MNGVHEETYLFLDDSPDARGADGQPAVRGMAHHISGSGPHAMDAVAALLGVDAGSSMAVMSSRLEQEMELAAGLHRSVLPSQPEAVAYADAAHMRPRHHGCRKHMIGRSHAQSMDAPMPLQDLVASRIPLELLSLLLSESAPKEIFLRDPHFVEPTFMGALEMSSTQSTAAREAALFGSMRDEQTMMIPESATPLEPMGLSWDAITPDGQVNTGPIVFMMLCVACAVVWLRLALLACTIRHTRSKRQCCFSLRHGKGASDLESPLLEPLAPEAANTDSLSIYHSFYPVSKEHSPYEVQVASDHVDPSAFHGNVVTIQYMPLLSENEAAKQ